MIKGAGILFLAPDQTALFLKRGNGGDHPGEWCFPGGTTEAGETALQTAEREAREELGFLPEGTRTVLARRVKVDPPAPVSTAGDVAPPPGPAPQEVDFTTFLQRVGEKFTPTVNGEHTGYAWAAVDAPPEPLHPGCRVALARLSLDELGVARAMQAGELTSPQRVANMTLFALRITGTGAAYRRSLNEFVYRRPENYLTPEFLARCNGLPVIMMHPPKATLDSKEFSDRIVGTVMLPYVQGDEVWGIAKIFDDGAISLLEGYPMSTSPTVVLNPADSSKMKLEDGSTLLIEGKPALLDHVAICEHGVWDKGEGPTGVSSTTATEGDQMTEEEKKAAEAKAKADAEKEVEAKAKADADAGQKLDTLLKCMDGLNARLDSIEEERKADRARMDAMEEERKADRARRDSEGEEAKKKAEEEAKKKADAEAEEKKKAEEEEAKKKADSQGDIAKRIADVERRLPMQLSDADYAKMADAQAKADSVYSALGLNGGRAPRPLDGETILAYRRRLTIGLKGHSRTWKDVDLGAIADAQAFDTIETQIYADAMDAALHPTDLPEDQLRSITSVDTTGRRITTFAGQPRAWMASFSAPKRRLAGIGRRDH